MTVTPAVRHIPDILDCLSQLSNDEVPTPPKLARDMLDLLPSDVWSNPDLKWLDPFSKSGIFLREVATRLLVGLAEWEPDFVARRDHIFRSMLYGNAITEMTGIIARRTVYCSRDASGQHSVVTFNHEHGQIPFVPADHDFGKNGAAETCGTCGAPAGLERGLGRENYAYSFTHGAYPTKEMAHMKFDVIVGNPPYQINDGGGRGTSAVPIYQLFVEQAIRMNPRYLVMITPSRWFTGGKGLDGFRERMIADRRMRALVDNPKIFDCFPGVKIRGGVSYFLWDRQHLGDCEVSTRIDGVIRNTATRDLRDGEGVVLRDNRAASIIAKAKLHRGDFLSEVVSPRNPFGFVSNFSESRPGSFSGCIPLVLGSEVGFLIPSQVGRHSEWVHKFKVLLPKASSGDTPVDDEGNITDVVLGAPIALAPGSVCSETYLVAGTFETKDETEHYAQYLATKFVRFLVLQRKTTQNGTADCFRFVPMLDMARVWTDQDLYDRFGLTEDERSYIEQCIKPRSVNMSLDSPIPVSHLPGGSKYRLAV